MTYSSCADLAGHDPGRRGKGAQVELGVAAKPDLVVTLAQFGQASPSAISAP